MKHRIFSLLAAIVMAFSFTACGSDLPVSMSYDLSGEPANLDPQSASGEAATTIINNIFEGLMTIDKEGQLVCGLAESYTVSDDQLTYRFKLKPDLMWSDGEHAVTAADFVFAFQRLFDPETRSETAAAFYCIKNAQQIAQGTAPMDSLGVRALSDTELEFTLTSPNTMFLQLLTTAPAMPCNQDFFEETKGTYGLDADSLLSTGPYELNSWVEDKTSYVRLYQNEFYYDAEDVALRTITMYTNTEPEEYVNRVVEGDTAAYTFSGEMDPLIAKSDDLSVSQSQDTVWGLLLNPSDPQLQNKNLRLALAQCLDRSRYASVLPEELSVADGIIPPGIHFQGKSYRTQANGVAAPKFDVAAAQQSYQSALAELQTSELDRITVLVPDDSGIDHEKYFSYLSQTIQKEFNLFIAVEELPQKELEQRISSGNYMMAIQQVSADYDHPISVLNRFSSNGQRMIPGWSNAEYESALDAALVQTDVSASLEFCMRAEQTLLNDAVILPMYYQSDYLVTNLATEGIIKNPQNGCLSFRFAHYVK